MWLSHRRNGIAIRGGQLLWHEVRERIQIAEVDGAVLGAGQDKGTKRRRVTKLVKLEEVGVINVDSVESEGEYRFSIRED